MKRIFLAIGSLALVAMLGLSLIGQNADAQDTATPEAGSSTTTESQTTETKESNKDAYLAALAANLGVTTEELQAAIDATNTELGFEGRISIGGWHQGGSGSSGDFNRPSGGNDGNRGGNGPGGMGGNNGDSFLRGIDLAGAATFLGITEDELKTELETGSFLEIAETHGKTIDDIRAFLIQQATDQIDERLQAASDAPAGDEATEKPAEESTTISEATEVPTAPALTPTATA